MSLLRPRARRGGAVVVALATCLAVAGGSQAFSAPAPDDAPDDVAVAGSLEGADLDVTQGSAAVEELERSGTLDVVAVDAGLEPDELRDELLEDPAMFVTSSGFVGYADTLEAPPVELAEPLVAAALPADVFALDSRPSSSRVLYLDFDGHVADDPAWGSVGYAGEIVSLPFDLDGSPTSFSTTEQTRIFETWQRVAEDYRPFDINVTTRDPGPEALRRTSIFDAAYGQRMVITPSNFTTASVVGVALLDVFDAAFDHAAYVFTDLAYKQTAKTMGEAVSHEAGHTFGLNHDGGPVSPNYYDGHGSWAPIMGRPLDPTRPVTQWSRGEYSGANNFEDDLAVIAALAGYRPDDHPDTTAAPSVVASNGVTVGEIEQTGDRDVFAVDVLAGTLSVQLRPPSGQAGVVEPGCQADGSQRRRSCGGLGVAGHPIRLDAQRRPDGSCGALHDRGRTGRLAHRLDGIHDVRIARSLRTRRRRTAGSATARCRSVGVHVDHSDPPRRHPQRHRRVGSSRSRSSGRGPGGQSGLGAR